MKNSSFNELEMNEIAATEGNEVNKRKFIRESG